MKRIYPLLLLSVFFICDISIYAQETDNISTQEVDSVGVDSTNLADESPEVTVQEETSLGFTQELKKRFIEGGPSFMGIVMLCLILGLAIAIERIIYLNLATTNSKKLITFNENLSIIRGFNLENVLPIIHSSTIKF